MLKKICIMLLLSSIFSIYAQTKDIDYYIRMLDHGYDFDDSITKLSDNSYLGTNTEEVRLFDIGEIFIKVYYKKDSTEITRYTKQGFNRSLPDLKDDCFNISIAANNMYVIIIKK